MDFLKECTISVASTVLIATIFSIFIPKGSMARLYKIILGFFIFISFLLPFTNIANEKFDYDFSFALDNNKVLEETESINENNVKTSTEIQIKNTLNEGGFDGCLVDISLNSKSDDYYIDSVVITIPSEYNKDEIKTYIYEKLGLNSTIVFNGE